MQRPVLSAPVLSPATMKQIVDTFTHQYQVDSPSSSDSPNSAYSSASPTLPDQPFGFDVEDEDVEVAHHDEDEYETLMAGNDGWDTPAWGRWPEATHGRPAWSPAPESVTGSGSLISVSPRGSLSNNNSARGSFGGKGKQPESADRRDSDASLLGFDLAQQRRRSSTRSLGSSTRRRSSGLSNFSTVDPIEDARLRSIASMELLRRRFSEVVEVTVASDGEEEDVALARNAVSQWSPYTASTLDDDDSEIHTAPYFPTPQLHSAVPAVLSNFPLSSVAAPNISATNDGDASGASSPIYPTHRLPVFSQPPAQPANGTSTPPTQPQPSMLLRERIRPAFPRATTDYQFPARSTGVPPGAAAPRPIFSRSVSTPIYSSATTHRDPPVVSEKRVAGPPLFTSNAFASGSFPLARAVPLGVSPLRESLRRQSVVSDGDSRRPSSIDPSDILAERRASLKESLVRRASMGARRSSGASNSPSRRESSGSLRRKSSLVPLEVRRLSGPDSRRSSLNDQRRTSLADRRRSSAGGSRKSSIVSISEYGYLGPQIVIDGPNAILETSSAETSPSNTRRPQLPSIVLPAFTFPSASTPASTPYTPRFNPLDSFFGRATSPSTAPTTPASTICPLSPASSATHSAGAETERSISSPSETQTPKKGTGIMDRGRPISPPEYRDYSIPLSRLHHSPRSPESGSGTGSRPGSRDGGKIVMVTPLPSSASTPALSPPAPTIPMQSQPSLSPEIAQLRPSVSRKAVPQMTSPDLRAELLHNEEMVNRRISTVLGAPPHGMSLAEIRPRAIAVNANAQAISPVRPSYRRQTTFPTELGSKRMNRRSLNNLRSLQDHDVPGEVSGSTVAGSPPAPKQPSVTFADDLIKRRSLPAGLPAGVARPSMNRASSFSRLFQTKQRGQGGSTSHIPTTVKLVQRQSDPQRSSSESTSSSERSLVEMTAVFRKVSGRRSTDDA